MRLLVLSAESDYSQLSFDEYGLMLYYAKKINVDKTIELYKSTTSEYRYKRNRGLLTGNLSSDDDSVGISQGEINSIITFIDDQIIPKLLVEPIGILQKYSGRQNFLSLFSAEHDLGDYIILDDDFQEDDADIYTQDSIRRCFEYLRNFLQLVNNNNETYKSFTKS